MACSPFSQSERAERVEKNVMFTKSNEEQGYMHQYFSTGANISFFSVICLFFIFFFY